MNQIQEKDWAEESWHSHTGIDSSCDYCIVDAPAGKAEEPAGKNGTEQAADAGKKRAHQKTGTIE